MLGVALVRFGAEGGQAGVEVAPLPENMSSVISFHFLLRGKEKITFCQLSLAYRPKDNNARWEQQQQNFSKSMTQTYAVKMRTSGVPGPSLE